MTGDLLAVLLAVVVYLPVFYVVFSWEIEQWFRRKLGTEAVAPDTERTEPEGELTIQCDTCGELASGSIEAVPLPKGSATLASYGFYFIDDRVVCPDCLSEHYRSRTETVTGGVRE